MYRAIESERPDAVFQDPYARTLGGARGEEILATIPRARVYGWPMVVRTAVMDDIIVRLVPDVDAVLNLAAGLDARPYRLPLRSDLRWIEVDYAATLDYKAAVLANATPRCKLERIALDLADRSARQALFARLGSECKRVAVISEGLLVYLTPVDAGLLADDLSAQPSFASWLTDVASPWVLRMMERTWGKRLREGGTPFQFAPADAAAFFAQRGWRIREYRANIIEAVRLKREYPMAWFFKLVFAPWYWSETTRRSGPMVGVVLFDNAKITA